MKLNELKEKILQFGNMLPPVQAYKAVKTLVSPQYREQVRQAIEPLKQKFIQASNYIDSQPLRMEPQKIIQPFDDFANKIPTVKNEYLKTAFPILRTPDVAKSVIPIIPRLVTDESGTGFLSQRFQEISRKEALEGHKSLTPEEKQILLDGTSNLVFGATTAPTAKQGIFKKAKQEMLEGVTPKQTPTQYVEEKLKNVKSSSDYDFVKDMDRTQRLRSLMQYEDDLARLGYTAKQRANMSVNKARDILNKKLPAKWNLNKQFVDETITKNVLHEESINNVKGKFRDIVAPLKNLQSDIRDAILKHDINVKKAKVAGVNISNFLDSKLDPKLEWKLVQYSQSPNPQTMKQLGLTQKELQMGADLIEKHRAFNDEIFARARASGMDINYLKNHIFQKWQQSPEEVDVILRGLSKKPGFTKHRNIRNFQEGMSIGLKPKYTTFRQLDAEAEYAFQKARANQELADTLFNGKNILPSNLAPSDWVQIQSPFFPKANVKIGIDQNIQVPYSASPTTANFLNDYFGIQHGSKASKFLDVTSNISKNFQDVVLSGGVKQANFFTLSNVIGDFTMAIGDFLTGNPRRAWGTVNATTKALFRGFLPDMSKKFETKHFKSIQEMAELGHGYSGSLDWQDVAKNVVSPEKKSLYNKVVKTPIDELFNKPTFQNFMFQRKVSLYENFRDSLVRGGTKPNEAKKQAVKILDTYMGSLDDLGRNKDFENAISSVFMAPKYREGLFRSFGNLAPAFTTKLTDPTFAITRKMGIGMIATLFLYEIMNRKLTGHSMADNPPGKELELVIPAPTKERPNRYISIPWLPGKTAIFRRILGTAMGIYKGDPREAWKQFSGLFSIPISKGMELATNKDYFGRDVIKDDTENYGPKPLQVALWAGKNLTPGPIREHITYAQDMWAYNKKKELGKDATKPNYLMTLARSAELPVKEGNLPKGSYFTVRDQVLKEYEEDDEAIASFKLLHPESEEFSVKEPKTPQERLMQASIRAYQPRVFQMEREIALRQNEKDGTPIDPLYLVDQKTAQNYLMSLTMIPGSEDKKQLYKDNPELSLLAEQRGDYFDLVMPDQKSTRPIASERVQQLMDQKQWKDPEVKKYLDDNRKYQNEQRAILGLAPLEDYSWGSYKKKVKVMKVAKAKKTNIKKSRTLALAKFNPFKKSKKKKGVNLAIKEPKITMAKLLASQKVKEIKAPKKAVIKLS